MAIMNRLSRRISASAIIFALVFSFLTLTEARAELPPRKTYKFINGQWFDGRKFERRVFYSVDGVLTAKQPRKIDEVIDLKGGYVVPPFGDAHNHYISGPGNIDASLNHYLKDGILYVKNPSSIPRDTNQIKGRINKPDSVDVVFSNGVLATSGGHPVALYEKTLSKFRKPGPDGTFENLAYYIIDSEADLEKKWPRILADKPDFIKTNLLYSEEYERRRGDPAFFGVRGMNPKLLPLIVARAHENNLRVSCHIETATDFRIALAAGIDEINHLPGYYPDFAGTQASQYPINEEDAAMAARKRVVVVTTTYVSEAELKTPDEKSRAREIQARNLRLLHKAGVKIALGPDVYGVTSLAEAMNLYELKAFDNLELLKMWCETTVETIFPNRKIGHLKEGYEASFLVLGGNPIDSFESVKDIRLRFKQGYFITLEDK
jgi:imidazolonepropionase-like amidohydrolase